MKLVLRVQLEHKVKQEPKEIQEHKVKLVLKVIREKKVK